MLEKNSIIVYMVYSRGIWNMKKGFTLSEVLVTMGIVGLISALTIPAIMKDYKNKVMAASIEKTYSQLSDATKAIMADEMADSLYKTRLATYDKDCGTDKAQGACYFLPKYFKTTKTGCGTKAYSPNNVCLGDVYQTMDGSHKTKVNASDTEGELEVVTSFGYCIQTTNGATICDAYNVANGIPTYMIDTNGPAEPNMAGKDFFTVDLMSDGIVADYGRGTVGPERCGTITSAAWHEWSAGCLNKIMQAGWRMNY